MEELKNKKKKILLAEDDKDLSEMYRLELEKEGFEIKCVFNGKEALKEILSFKPDLLLLDIIMPEVDGWQVLKEISKIKQKGFQNMKVFVLSNLSEKDSIEKGIDFGIEKYFIKTNFTPKEIVEEIKKTLNKNKK